MNKKFTILLIVVVFFVFYIFRKKEEPLPVTNENTQQSVIKLVDGRQCYTYSHDATDTEPYSTTDFMDITISDSKVTGTRRGTQKGPDMTNGYTGTMTGALKNNKITSVLSYTIEGSKNKEEEIFQAGITGLDKLRYELIERKGTLVPDTTKEFKILKYSRVECEGSN